MLNKGNQEVATHMAARLPQPGGDYGQWGQILNEYLRVVHDETGALKSGVVDSTNIAGTLPQSKVASLSSDLASKLTQAQADSRYVRTVNNVSPDVAGNVTVGGSGGAVDSVNGQTGAVTLDASDVGAAAASHGHAINDTTGLQSALDTLTSNTTAAQASADDALSVLQTSVMYVVVWNTGTSSWPSRPSGVPAGMVTYNSTNDAAAATPTSALAGDLWAKALA